MSADAFFEAMVKGRAEKLERFVRKFLGNFQPCDECGGKGVYADETECLECYGSGKRVASYGVLFFDLPQEAEELLR